jgi:outer membrane protein assembly factor BamE (lipoprotein component of BamABCDE complex)
LLLLLLVLVVSCTGQRITKANVDQVAEGMSKKQVESILGPPTDIDNKDFVIMKKTTYVYRQGKDTVTIVFKDDKVTEKQSTLAD